MKRDFRRGCAGCGRPCLPFWVPYWADRKVCPACDRKALAAAKRALISIRCAVKMKLDDRARRALLDEPPAGFGR